MENLSQFRKLGHTKARGWLFLMVLVAFTHLLFQSFLLPYGKALRSMLPDNEVSRYAKYNVSTVRSSTKSVMVRNPLTVNASDLIDTSASVELENDADSFYKGGELGFETEKRGNDRFKEVSVTLENKGFVSQHVLDRFVDNSFPSKNSGDVNGISTLVSIQNEESDALMDKASKDRPDFPLKQIREPDLAENISLSLKKSDGGLDTPFQPSTFASSAAASMNTTYLTTSTSSKRSSLASVSEESDLVISKNHSAIASIPGRKKMRCEMPPKSITSFQEMNHVLARHRAKSRSMRPRWSSIRDHEILALKPQIEHAPPAINDRELYAPLFRNISMFKRKVKFTPSTLSALFNAGSQSYELMERTLKVYVYKEGEKPIFHQPILKGLYASEGWFMKLMEGNRRFIVKDPRRAHLFYMPFSSRMLEYSLYVRNSHNRTNLRQYLKEYTEKIAAKYPYFNRTGGADHFLVACHDWAPYETRHHMERCMKALCNADVTAGFKIGRDVSLPETYVRSARNPLRDLGGKPPSQRHILAFYAGNMHGYLRPILLKYWKGKDHDMKIFGPMPPGVASKMNYIQHMKSSKFCICPKGYEVNSPRVVEAIFYECVPVIISDNFVPPYFEVLNWEAFSVVLAEKDIPRLKDILLAIPKEKYLDMQLAVRKVQKHFLWHAKPMKYDLFHMTLHSIWYNRVFQIKPR